MTITGLQGVLGQPGSTILVENGVFNMYGGKINGNTKDSAIPIAGTIAHYNPGVANITAEINLYGGEITGNIQKYSTSAYYAGAVIMIVAGNPAGSSAAFRMTGGIIADNDSSTRGKAGGVHLYGSAVRGTISGGQIDRNTAYEGGAIYVGNGATLDITGGSCTGNKALDGAGVYIGWDTKVNLKNYRITDNVAENDGIPGNSGGIAIHLSNSNSVIGSPDAGAEPVRIFGNQCEGDGGGLYVFQIRGDKENILVQNTEITQNQANSAAGVCIAGTEVMLKNTVVTQNHSTKTPAGGIAVRGAHDYFFGPVSPDALKLADQVTVWDNSAVGADGTSVRSNVYLAQNDAKYADNAPVKITIAGKLDETSRIGVTEECAEVIGYALEQNDAPVPSPNFTTGLAQAIRLMLCRCTSSRATIRRAW